MADLPELDLILINRCHCTNDIADKTCSFFFTQQPVEVPGLGVVIVIIIRDAVGFP
ncbi:hypothetical protein D3C75_1387110 [compost metagenome]